MEEACRHKWIHIKQSPLGTTDYYGQELHFRYKCSYCEKTLKSKVALPSCEHSFQSDSNLGKDYAKYQACIKCNAQRVLTPRPKGGSLQ